MTDQYLSEMRGESQRDSTTFQEAARAGIGFDQTWQDVSASRVVGDTYPNDTGKPIQVSICNAARTGTETVQFWVDSVLVIDGSRSAYDAQTAFVSIVVPVGSTYRYEANGFDSWTELRS